MTTMYTHFCEPVHGGHAGPLVKYRPLNATDRAAGKLVSGRVVTLNSSGEFVAGPANNHAMPLFLFQGSDAPSVYNTGTVDGVTSWVPMSGSGEGAIALVASGGYEIQTTEFDSTRTYVPNQPLTSDANGKVTNVSATPYTNWIIGVTSVHENAENIDEVYRPGEPPRGRNANGKEVLTFWSVYLPTASA